jgi:hypothetical protein
VLASFDEAADTFLQLRTATSKIWVAVPRTPVQLGSVVRIQSAIPASVEEVGFRRRFGSLRASPFAPVLAEGLVEDRTIQ